MPSYISRRTFFASLAGTAGAAWLVTHTGEVRAALEYAAQLPADGQPDFKVLKPQDAADLEAAMAQIIPTDATPGAREARAIHFLDRALDTFASSDRAIFETIAAELRERAVRKGAPAFARLSSRDQIDVLKAYEREESGNFQQLRGITIFGMMANPSYGGNHNKLGWKMVGFNDQFSWTAPFGWYDQQGG